MQRDNINDEKKEIGSDVKIRADLFWINRRVTVL